MERKIVKNLLAWKNNPRRQPLLLQGARQVGKTYILLSFGKKYYKNVLYLSMEESREISAIFERDLNPERIIRELAALNGQSVFPGETLLILDEIQACENALASLKYFAERAPQYHVIAAGSLPGVAMKRVKYAFPVGKTDMLRMYPLDFEEFLVAIGRANIGKLIRESYNNMTSFSLHDTAMDLYKIYLAIGGMPRAVYEYTESHDFDYVKALLATLNDSYIADMAKYAVPHETIRIMAAWSSVPAQLAKENHKFQYKIIKSGARAKDYEVALDWLEAAGMINKCIHATEGKMPVSAYAENEIFKVYMVDTGLLCSKYNIPFNTILYSSNGFEGFKGALAENYVMQALVTNGIKPYYWSSQGRAEVDFIFQDKRGNIIPLEVKSAENVRSKSLRYYTDKYNPEYSIRISGKNFGFENNIKSIPLYAAFCLDE